ncbi:MAG TPA: Uma2 family endonuclease [Planctomycetaceae bacterium]|nr:Uma2 family endonuclease [Planctomycetaceae bacterium]
MSVPVQRRRFTVDEYEQMTRAGVFHEDGRLELIEGEIIEMAPVGSRHAACVNRLNQVLGSRLGRTAIVSIQNPVRLTTHSQPQPDVAVLKRHDDFYEVQPPRTDGVLLVIEVAETSSDYDRQVKLPLYADAGTGEVWLVDPAEGVIHQFNGPSGKTYRQRETIRRGRMIRCRTIPALSAGADEALGR